MTIRLMTPMMAIKEKIINYTVQLKGNVHPNMIISYLVVFGALRRMVKAQGACDKPFWIYKRLNICVAPAPGNDVSVVEDVAFYVTATTETSSLARHGGNAIIQSPMYPKRLIARSSDLHHSTRCPKHKMKYSFFG